MKKKGVATPSHIRHLWSTASILGKSKRRFRTRVVTAFYGFLRPSELCVSKAGHYLTQDLLKIGKNKHSISLTLRTLKHSTVAATIKLKKEGSGCCPVATMEKYIQLYIGSIQRMAGQPNQSTWSLEIQCLFQIREGLAAYVIEYSGQLAKGSL